MKKEKECEKKINHAEKYPDAEGVIADEQAEEVTGGGNDFSLQERMERRKRVHEELSRKLIILPTPNHPEG